MTEVEATRWNLPFGDAEADAEAETAARAAAAAMDREAYRGKLGRALRTVGLSGDAFATSDAPAVGPAPRPVEGPAPRPTGPAGRGRGATTPALSLIHI